ncbi:unnamed protein product [Trichogramma brassicae]|uniref:Uncharacterized protein n=1 Tax=Trichogramma brassicae TaxID=86971 RepID=A0A6H5J3X3_9HYME|nr:unnamed protein product [Trichogramma brassicae]
MATARRSALRWPLFSSASCFSVSPWHFYVMYERVAAAAAAATATGPCMQQQWTRCGARSAQDAPRHKHTRAPPSTMHI